MPSTSSSSGTRPCPSPPSPTATQPPARAAAAPEPAREQLDGQAAVRPVSRPASPTTAEPRRGLLLRNRKLGPDGLYVVGAGLKSWPPKLGGQHSRARQRCGLMANAITPATSDGRRVCTNSAWSRGVLDAASDRYSGLRSSVVRTLTTPTLPCLRLWPGPALVLRLLHTVPSQTVATTASLFLFQMLTLICTLTGSLRSHCTSSVPYKLNPLSLNILLNAFVYHCAAPRARASTVSAATEMLPDPRVRALTVSATAARPAPRAARGGPGVPGPGARPDAAARRP